MLRVGLTGGIACGKSHVLRRLGASGCQVLDLDAVSRDVMAPGGSAYGDVVAAFGAGILAPDASIDRTALARLVFADAAARERLNALVHPRIRTREAEFAARHAAEPGAVAVVDGALLVEVGMHLRFDRLVVVHCTTEEQLARLQARDGLDPRAARARVQAQMPPDQKRSFAHFTVSTSGAPEGTDRRADLLASALRRLSRERPQPVRIPVAFRKAVLAAGPPCGPEGLTPAALLDGTTDGAGLDLQALVQSVGAARPWYQPPPAAGGPGPELLGPALVAGVLAARGADLDYLMGAARALAAAFRTGPTAVVRTTWTARLGFEAVVAGTLPGSAWLRSEEALAPLRAWGEPERELSWAEELVAQARTSADAPGTLGAALAALALRS